MTTTSSPQRIVRARPESRLARLARLVTARRRLVVGVWIGLTLFGVFATGQMTDRWFESASLPGREAYDANQRMLETFGTGAQAPLVAVFRSRGAVTEEAGIERAIAAAAAQQPGARVSSYWSTGTRAYVSADGRTTFAEIYPAGQPGFNGTARIDEVRTALKQHAPPGVEAFLTGRDPLVDAAADGDPDGPSVLLEAIIGGVGCLVILFFVFGTLPAVLMPLVVAAAAILNTFTLVWLVSYLTDVSLIVQFLIALVGLGVAIDYALLMIFRFRDELRDGKDTETALVETMIHAGHSVIVSGSTVAIGLLAMIALPIPFLRSIGIGGILIPAVSVLASLTLLPALLAMLGPRINSVRLLPKRLVDRGHPEDGAWGRWARLVMRRPLAIATVGLIVVGLLVIEAARINPNEIQAKDYPGRGDAIDGRQALTDAGITHGALKPFVVLVENGADPAPIADRLSRVDGVAAAVAPPDWQRAGRSMIEAFPSADGSARETAATVERVRAELDGTDGTLGGIAAEERDFIDAVYSNFPYVLAFVVLLTFLLLARAFRSVMLALKAVLLNLVSLAAALGVIVFVFQHGHGSEAIWNLPATDSISPWIPLMIFAFLYGLSMDYEVFMLSRIREAYDATGDTTKAVELGLARTGKLVTSAALVLMFAFFVLSTSPGVEVKQFGIGLAAGIILDATIIRALLVPALMRLLGRWNWWLPQPAARLLLLRNVPTGPLREQPERA